MIGGRSDIHTYGRLDGHTVIPTDPNYNLIENVVTKFLFSTAQMISRISGHKSIHPQPIDYFLLQVDMPVRAAYPPQPSALMSSCALPPHSLIELNQVSHNYTE